MLQFAKVRPVEALQSAKLLLRLAWLDEGVVA